LGRVPDCHAMLRNEAGLGPRVPPWYVPLFGRDTLVVTMETISGFPEFATGALDQLARFPGDG
jgi:glycogen debranching enzyme